MTKQEFLKQIDLKEPTVFIMRGIPGSGKSTLSKDIKDISLLQNYQCRAVSADDFFVLFNGDYKFNPSYLRDAHEDCLRNFCNRVAAGYFVVIVDNTNIDPKDFDHYVKIASAFGYKVNIVTSFITVEDASRNIHNVPPETINKMYLKINNPDVNSSLRKLVKNYGCHHFIIEEPLEE
jgi:predicted kinase